MSERVREVKGLVEKLFFSGTKTLLKQGLRAVDEVLPDIKEEDLCLPNSITLFRLRDEFFTHENNPGYTGIFRTIFNLFIAMYDGDMYYRERLQWLIKRFREEPWEEIYGEEVPREPCWKQ